MSNLSGALSLLTLLAAAIHSSPSSASNRCPGLPLKLVGSLASLPGELRKELPEKSSGFDGIADRDGNFNEGDVVIRGLPDRRFALAAIGSNCAVIAVEHGGYARWFELNEYRLVGAKWTVVTQGRAFIEPISLDDLLDWQSSQ